MTVTTFVECAGCGFLLCKCGPTTQPVKEVVEIELDENIIWGEK